jgi:hypothetical protein
MSANDTAVSSTQQDPSIHVKPDILNESMESAKGSTPANAQVSILQQTTHSESENAKIPSSISMDFEIDSYLGIKKSPSQEQLVSVKGTTFVR